MGVLSFDFTEIWDMGEACGDDVTASDNPAPKTKAGIYIIHNANENTTYVGYADNAKNRWGSRYEALHCFGIPNGYGKKILCAFCIPTFDGPAMQFCGNLGCEHILIRAVVKGLLGVTTCTNTKLANTAFAPGTLFGDIEVRVYFPVGHHAKWGSLENAKNVKILKNTAY